MSTPACEALRQIQLGNLTIRDFIPPQVFKSEHFKQYKVTMADLRQHLLDCGACGEAMNRAMLQLKEFDEEWSSIVIEQLESVLNGLDEDLDMLPGLPGDTDGIYETELNFAHLRAVQDHVRVGKSLRTFFEVLFTTAQAFDAASLKRRAGRLEQETASPCVTLPKEVGEILVHGAAGTAREALRALLLADSFYGYFEPEREGRRYTEIWGLKARDADGIEWMRIWQHFSTLADLEVDRLRGLDPEASSSKFSELIKQLEAAFDTLVKIDQRTESLLDGQTAMMERICQLERATRELLDQSAKAREDIRASCQQTLVNALYPVWAGLEDRTRDFLLAAEYGYTQYPADMDFSCVITLFTKAFEFELKRALKPAEDALKTFVDADPRQKVKKPVERLTLGELYGLFERNPALMESILSKCGLGRDQLRTALHRVNAEVDAKHLARKTKAEATSFREFFLGRQSALRVLFPQKP